MQMPLGYSVPMGGMEWMGMVPGMERKRQKVRRKFDGAAGFVRYTTGLADLGLVGAGGAARACVRAAVQPNFGWLGAVPMPQANLQRPWEDVCVQCVQKQKVEERNLKLPRVPFSALAWTPDGAQLICLAERLLVRYNDVDFNYDTHNQLLRAPGRCLRWLATDRLFLTGDEAGGVHLWNSAFQVHGHWAAQQRGITDIGVGPRDIKFATASDDHTVTVYDIDGERADRTIAAHEGPVLSCDWHPASSLIASAGTDSALNIWDARSGTRVASRHDFQDGSVSRVRWNPNGNWLAAGGQDCTIQIYDIRRLEPFCHMRGHPKEVSALAWHPVHERLLASGCTEGAILQWLVGYPEPVASVFRAHKSRVTALAWHPAAHLLASSSDDCYVGFWTRLKPGDSPTDSASIMPLKHDRTDHPADIPPAARMRYAAPPPVPLPPSVSSGSAPAPAPASASASASAPRGNSEMYNPLDD